MTLRVLPARFLLLSPVVVAAGLVTSGCETSNHSQGLIDQKPAAGVNDPYIVRDPDQKQRASTQPAGPAPTQ